MKQVAIGFGLLITALLVLFKVAAYNRLQGEDSPLTWIAVFSILFFVIGIFLARKLFVKKVQVKEEIKEAKLFIDEDGIKKAGISKRELEILQLIDEGLSNQQIADKLFVSEHTVKKHISNLFFKLDVQRRTEAVKKAKTMRLIA
ncbi:MAG TPA: LuxR C-terminal-related transcriptional regulator [Chitinophagaceae bacterium]|nr:LuxR C-terminal-related transcriptional regulator [Chitinophagaceae bacterium]